MIEQETEVVGKIYAGGVRGYSAYEVAVNEGFEGTEEEWLETLVGPQGEIGPDGKSAYEVAVENGYEGTQEQWTNDFLTPDGYYNKQYIDNSFNSRDVITQNQTNAINVLNSRMDEFATLEEGSTTGDAELIDIRTGVEGKVYSNAGDAVRGQIDSISELTDNINTLEVGRYAATSSSSNLPAPTANTKMFGLKDKIPCLAETVYAISYITVDDINPQALVKFYDSNGDYMSSESKSINLTTTDIKGVVIKTPANASYLYVHFYYSTGITFDDKSGISIVQDSVVTPYRSYISAVDEIAREGQYINYEVEETDGFITSSGNLSTDTTYDEKYTQLFNLDLLKKIQIKLTYTETRAMWMVYATYDANGDFIERNDVIPSGLSSQIEYGVTIVNKNQNAKYIRFSWRNYNEGIFTLKAIAGENYIQQAIDTASEALLKSDAGLDSGLVAAFPGRFKPCFDHLFVQDSVNAVIPHESIYHVRLSRLMGFNMIEGNVKKTSDGVFIVNHLSSDKFGNYFHHVDGVTDISNVAINTVTWDWIVQNVRYNSTIPKYRTRPCRLEEFLMECRQQNIIPLVTCNNSNAVNIIEGIMGKNNFIAYQGDRNKLPTAILTNWVGLSTKQEILDYCKDKGRPYIYSMSNPSDFTDEELRDIIDTLHKNGFWISTSYADTDWYKYSYLGFDLLGTQTRLNRLRDGNICNLDSVFGFNDFDYTNATEINGALVYSSNGTLTPKIESESVSIGGIDIELCFSGTITIPDIGKHQSTSYTSDGSYPVFVATPVINGSINPIINVASGTTITDVKFKATKF